MKLLSLSYPAHDAFIDPARKSAEIWRLVLGLCLAFALSQLMAVIYLRVIQFGIEPIWPGVLRGLQVGQTVPTMFLLLFSFGLITLSVVVVARVLHRRPAVGLLGPQGLAWRQFRVVTVMLALIASAIFLLPPWDMGAPLVPNLAPGTWAVLLPLSLLAVFVQVSAEEVIFRGYVQQQLAARFRSPLIWMVLPSALFAIGHYQPGLAGENAVPIAIWSGVFGILMADLTARAGSLGPAIAVHFCNNVLALLIVALPDTLTGLALYLAPFGMSDTEAVRAWLPVDFVQMIVFWLAARLALRR